MGTLLMVSLTALGALFAQEEVPPRWRPDSLGMAVLSVIIFTVIGIVASLAGDATGSWASAQDGNLSMPVNAWQLVRGQRRWDHRLLGDARHHGERRTGVLAAPVWALDDPTHVFPL